MNGRKRILNLKFWLSLLTLVGLTAGCQQNVFQPKTIAPATLRDVSALKLSYRFEADVPAPTVAAQPTQSEERNQPVQNDFDTNRPQESLDKTVFSPDKQRILAVYHKVEDVPNEHRLDIYAADGKLVRKVTPNGMAVHFPDTIVWSPDGTSVAFVGMTRNTQNAPPIQPLPTPTEIPNAETNANVDTNANSNANVSAPPVSVPNAPASVLTFRTEQVYLCGSDGGDLKPVTQNEGLIYFYFVWSPDSAALVALAATWREWQVGQAQANQLKEIYLPAGRPRLIEKNGRERRLDDNVTAVQPVWSPDSSKVALAFDREIRIYDAIGDQPTQAAIPLRNQLLLSSQKYDNDLRQKESNAGGNAANAANANAEASTLPDENLLVSFNPITELEWTQSEMLYLQTGYVRQMQNAADSARSYLRWHRMVFSPQAISLGK